MPQDRWSEHDLQRYLARRGGAPTAPDLPPAGGEVTFALPWPPTGNHAYPQGQDGRRHLAKGHSAYRQAVLRAVLAARVPAFPAVPLALTIDFHPPAHLGRWDMDNRLKSVQDALVAAGVLVEDRWIFEIHMRKAPATEQGHAFVTLQIQIRKE